MLDEVTTLREHTASLEKDNADLRNLVSTYIAEAPARAKQEAERDAAEAAAAATAATASGGATPGASSSSASLSSGSEIGRGGTPMPTPSSLAAGRRPFRHVGPTIGESTRSAARRLLKQQMSKAKGVRKGASSGVGDGDDVSRNPEDGDDVYDDGGLPEGDDNDESPMSGHIVELAEGNVRASAIRVLLDSGTQVFLADVLETYLQLRSGGADAAGAGVGGVDGLGGGAGAGAGAGGSTSSSASVATLQRKLDDTETDLRTLSQRFVVQSHALESLRDEHSGLLRRLEAERAFNDAIKDGNARASRKNVTSHPSGAASSSTSSSSSSSSSGQGASVDEGTASLISSTSTHNDKTIPIAVGEMYRKLAEDAERKAAELARTVDACRAELAQEQQRHFGTERRLREVTERLQKCVSESSSLHVMLEGLGLHADALKRAEDIIAGQRKTGSSTSDGAVTPSSTQQQQQQQQQQGLSSDVENLGSRARQALATALALKQAEKDLAETKQMLSSRDLLVESLTREKVLLEEHIERLQTLLSPSSSSSSSLSSSSSDTSSSLASGMATPGGGFALSPLPTSPQPTPGTLGSPPPKDPRYIALSAQLAKVSLAHVHCPATIAKLQLQLQEAERVLEGSKLSFARWKSQTEADLDLERDRNRYLASKLQVVQDGAAEARAEVRTSYERTLAVVREQNRANEKRIFALVNQLEGAGIEPVSAEKTM